jgi:hypothetical protein
MTNSWNEFITQVKRGNFVEFLEVDEEPKPEEKTILTVANKVSTELSHADLSLKTLLNIVRHQEQNTAADNWLKRAVMDASALQSGPQGGAPPADPAAMGGGAPPMDPSMMGGGAPPMDPSMMGGGAPPPMDPSMMGGGAPPMDPSMMGGAPPMDPSMMSMMMGGGGATPPGGDTGELKGRSLQEMMVNKSLRIIELLHALLTAAGIPIPPTSPTPVQDAEHKNAQLSVVENLTRSADLLKAFMAASNIPLPPSVVDAVSNQEAIDSQQGQTDSNTIPGNPNIKQMAPLPSLSDPSNKIGAHFEWDKRRINALLRHLSQ